MDKYKQLKRVYKQRKAIIVKRLNEFKNNTDIFAELCFCLLTPQSKAKICWSAVISLKKKGLLKKGSPWHIQKYLTGVRFGKKKSEYIVQARKKLAKIKKILKSFKSAKIDELKLRQWFVKNIVGLGYKEASHFLRNIGLGENFAILDRHILKNLKILGVIEKIPTSLTRKKYIEIENKMKEFAQRINIPLSHLDLLFWSKETGEIFK